MGTLIDFKVYCPSYKRPKIAVAHKLFKKENFCYVVRESEANEYKYLGVEILAIPEGAVTNIADTRNWILDNKTTKYLVMVDDDLKAVRWTVDRQLVDLSVDEIYHVMVNSFMMCEDADIGLWGMNLLEDPMAYSINKPIQFARPILGPFFGILDQELRYDESIPLKEDYDYFLQSLRKYRRCLRFDYLSYYVDHQKLPGGCQEIRTAEKEKEQNRLFQEKWGSKIVRKNHRNKNSINMRVFPPL